MSLPYPPVAQVRGGRLQQRRASVAMASVCIWLLFAAPLLAQPLEQAGASSGNDATSAEQQPQFKAASARLILVVGAAGTPEYGEQFENDAAQWRQLTRSRNMELVEISSDSDRTQREHLQAAIAGAQTDNVEQLWIVFIGHGTSERGVHKLNLTGADVTSRELADWLRAGTPPVIFIACASASAPFLPELSAPGRVIVTATRSGSENNYSRFGSQLATSLQDPDTDIDHDEEVSLLEAFLAASAKTEKFYREQSRLATEHALLDDNGDKLGIGAEFFRGTRAVKAAQAGKELDGEFAGRIILYSDPSLPQLSPSDQARRAEIEAKINDLRSRRPTPPTARYWDELEGLLLQLAEVYDNAS